MYANSIKVKSYKCFNDKLEGFDKILPINIIIGKNNSGKSTLIDIVEILCDTSDISDREIYSELIVDWPYFKQIFEDVYGINYKEKLLMEIYDKCVKDKIFLYKYEPTKQKAYFRLYQGESASKISDNELGYNLRSVFQRINFTPFTGKVFVRVNAERDIQPEISKYEINIGANGTGVTNLIQQFLNRKDLQKHKIIKVEFLNCINEIVNPEIKFVDISIQISNSDSKWEICFEDDFGNNIFLSQMGSGIKTIILVLVNLVLLPNNRNIGAENFIFAFEELENNLHPSLQRKLYTYINEYSVKNKSTFFITTHSNVGIDVFYGLEHTQLISVQNSKGISSCKTIIQHQHVNEIFGQLGFKASDLLQTNGIIWVEGPSDRIYLKSWIRLINNSLKEGVHYSIMFYGGKLLSNLTFDDSNLDDFISLLKINRNAFVIIDKDARTVTSTINKTKERIQSEIGSDNCWITQGREIENYLTFTTLKKW